MPKISVIVPVYKVEPYLHRCIDSILSQTFADFELILIDDGSPDNCPDICDEYAGMDNRIHVIHQRNGGLSAARNAGLDYIFANSDNEWIAFVDSDDWIHPQYLELLYLAADSYNVNISQCLHIETNGTNELPAVEEQMNLITVEEQYIEWYSAFAWGKLYRKECFQELRYPVGKLYEDVLVWYKLLFAEKNIAIVRETLYYYFVRPDGIVRNAWIPAKLAQIEAWEEQVSFLASYGNRDLLNCAVMHLFQILQSQLLKISKSKSISWIERIKYRFLVRLKLHKTILRFRNTPYYLQKKLSILSSAFPVIMWFYWFFLVINRKFLNIFRKRKT